MICQILLSGKSKNNITDFSWTELAKGMVKVKRYGQTVTRHMVLAGCGI